MTKGFEEAKKSNENPSPELKPLIGYLMAVELVKHTTDGVTAARLMEQHSLKMEHIPSTLLTSKEVKMCFSSFINVMLLLLGYKVEVLLNCLPYIRSHKKLGFLLTQLSSLV